MAGVSESRNKLGRVPKGANRSTSEVDARVAGELARQVLADECGGVSSVVPPSFPRVDLLHRTIRDLLFPGCFHGAATSEGALEEQLAGELRELRELMGELVRASILGRCCDPLADESAELSSSELDERVEAIADGLIAQLPGLRVAALEDIGAAYDGDPAAASFEEIILCYPGIEAVYAHRVAHAFDALGVPTLPRMISERAHSRTGVDIHPSAVIGRACFIDHATGVVIGQTAELGDRVTLYQGVTIGAKKFERDAEGRMVRGIKRHPTIGNDVTIYAGAVILGGDTVIGDGCVISANVYLSKSVPAGHVVRQKQGELQMVPLG
jgi:serine O-acetyltransferase